LLNFNNTSPATVGRVTRLCSGWSCIWFLGEAQCFSSQKCPPMPWDPPNFQWLLRPLPLGIKWLQPAARDSPPSSGKVENEWSYTSASPVCLCGMCKDSVLYNLTFVVNFGIKISVSLWMCHLHWMLAPWANIESYQFTYNGVKECTGGDHVPKQYHQYYNETSICLFIYNTCHKNCQYNTVMKHILRFYWLFLRMRKCG